MADPLTPSTHQHDPHAPAAPSVAPAPAAPAPGVWQTLDRTAPFPYPRREYLGRLLWRICTHSAVRFSPRRLWRWRRFWLHRFGARGAGSISPRTVVWHPWLLEIGEHSIVADGVTVYNLGQVTIGRHTVISQDAYLCAGTHDYTRPDLPLLRSTISIGSGVWICAGAFIGPGVRIGDNSVIGARAVVSRDVPPGVVVAGNPARVVKERKMKVEEGRGV